MKYNNSLQAFFDNQVVGMMEVDAEGHYLLVNHQWTRMIGYSREELNKTGFKAITHPEDLPAQLLLDDELIKGKRSSYRMDKRYIHKDGSIFWGDLSVTGLYDKNGVLTGMIGMVVDISEKKEAESNLQKAQELQKALLDASPDIICFMDGTGRWLLANKTKLNLFQLDNIDYRGKTAAELAAYCPFYSTTFTNCKKTDEQAWDTGQILIKEEIIPTPDNGNKTYEIIKTPLFHADGSRKALVVLGRDISARKRNEDRIKESESRFRTLINQLEHIPVQGYDENRRVTYWNTASTETYGYSREEALGQKLEDLIIPTYMRDEIIKSIQLWLTGERPVPAGKITLRDKNGQEVPVYSSHILHTTATGAKELFCVDIDLRMLQQAEDQVRRLAAALEQTSESIVITDTQGIIEYVNPAFTTVTGYTREEAIGQNPRILNSGEQDKAIYSDLWNTISRGKPWKGRFINRKKDGSRFIEGVNISPIFSPDGTIINYLAAKRDITEQLLTAEKYQQAQKMEAIGLLAGGIAHDFNNMLAITLGQVEIALMKIEPGDPLEKRLQEIKTAANRSADLTQQLLGYARKQSYHPQTLNLNETVATMLTMLKRLIGEHLELRWYPEAKLPLAEIDPGHFNQILTNLIINARDSIDSSGTISVKTMRASFDKKFCQDHPGSTAGEYILLQISDTGCGMDQSTIDKIFDPFFTTKETGKGTGLGLSMVFGLVKQNNGYILVNSTPGQGSIFKLYFPRVPGRGNCAIPSESETLVRGNETILVVEDESSLLDVTISMLGEAGYTVLSAQGPFAAIQLTERYKGTIQLLLTDVVMPKMSGVDLSQNLLKIQPEMRVLYISGYPKNSFLQENQQEVEIQLLGKPFSAYKLTQKVREVLDA